MRHGTGMQFVIHGALVVCPVTIANPSMPPVCQGFGTLGKLWCTLIKVYMDLGETCIVKRQEIGALGIFWNTQQRLSMDFGTLGKSITKHMSMI